MKYRVKYYNIAGIILFTSMTWGGSSVSQNVMGDVNNNSGIVTQGQTGNNTIVSGNQRAVFRESIALKILEVVKDKSVDIYVKGIGGEKDQSVVNDYIRYFQNAGLKVMQVEIGALFPPPSSKFSVNRTQNGYDIIIAPSAIE